VTSAILALVSLILTFILFDRYRIKRVQKEMAMKYGSRGNCDLAFWIIQKGLNDQESSQIQALWSNLAEVLKYPSEESMWTSDSFSDLIVIHNFLRLHWMFEDVLEIVESIDMEIADFARERNLTLLTISDLLDCVLSVRRLEVPRADTKDHLKVLH
jgi:hypothetical protein